MAKTYSFSTRPGLLKVLLCLLGLVAAKPALSQVTYTPVALTASSFTADVIADGAATALASTTNGFDTGGTDIQYCLVAANFVSPTKGATSRGLPVSRVLQSAQAATSALTFQLQPYSSNNSLRISGTGTGTMTLATPQSAQSVWLCAATGNGAPSGSNPVTATVQFTDGTTQVFNLNVSDWFYGASYVANNLGRVGRPNDQFDNTTNEPRLYQFELALATTNYTKLVSSVSFSKTQPTGVSTPTVFNGLALTLASVCTLPSILTASATPATICLGQSAQLSLGAGTPNGNGFTAQWQSSPDGVTWTDIPGATGTTTTVTPTATTRYRYRVACGAGSSNTSNVVTVTVIVPSASVAYGATTYCRTGTATPTVSPAGGTFTSSPAGLSINATTGVIDLAASTAGTYTVSYTSPGQCPATATANITILDPQARLAYSGTLFCRVGTSGAPTFSPAGGTFSSTAGLALNTTTGVIDLAASTPGTYTVTYASGGQCSASATASVTVKSDALPTFPNVLVPSGKPFNQALKLQFDYPADVTGFHLQVYNRWGRKMYDGNDPAQGWSPGEASGGVYYYLVDYTDCAGRPQHYKGWVEVIK